MSRLRIGVGLAALVLSTALAQLAHAATIVRDEFGVPHIYGKTVADAFFGYGYAVAEDRLFQLEMRRRQATGKLAAVLGSEVTSSATGKTVDVLKLDIQTLADYDAESLRQQFDRFTPEEQDLIRGYLDGINRRIAHVNESEGALLPPQFRAVWGTELAARPLNPWTLDDLLAATTSALTSFVSQTHAQDNVKLLAALRERYPGTHQAIFDTLLWLDDPYAPTTRADHARMGVSQIVSSQTHAHSGPDTPVVLVGGATEPAPEVTAPTSSMAILVGKEMTGSGSFQLNVPQPGWSLPGYYYTVGLHAPGFDVVGHAPGGLLVLTTGDNGHIAWGSTNARGDQTLVFEETLSPDLKQYRTKDGLRNVQTKTALIEVKGQSARPVAIHRTHRGPFTTALTDRPVYSKQVLWKGHELHSAMAWLRASQARNWDQFHTEGQKMAIGYNWFYSDNQGNIGWLFGGFLPDETPDQMKRDARLPVVGAEYGDLKGRTWADRVYLFNPPQGYIVNWNNKPFAGFKNTDLTLLRWSQGDRGNILLDLMASHERARKTFTEEDVRGIYARASTMDVNFHHFHPLLQKVDASAAEPDVRQALQLVLQWNGQRLPDATEAHYDNPAVPIFQAWLNHFVKLTVGSLLSGPELKEFVAEYTGTLQLSYMKSSVNLSIGTKIALRALQAHFGLRPAEIPAYDVLGGRNPQQLMLEALAAAVVDLKRQAKGVPMEQWRKAMVPQEFFPENYESVPTASTAETLRLASSANRGVMHRLAIGGNGRMLSWDANPPGTSSQPGSDHFRDQLSIYAAWGLKPLPLNPKPMTTKVVERGGPSKL